MAARFAINSASILVICLCALSFLAAAGCRRAKNQNLNANSGPNASNPADPEQAKRDAQALVDQGKELYRNEQNEQAAAEKFKQAINIDPDNAEAHLRLGMSYAALDKKTEAEEEYKKSIELNKKRVQADPRDANAFFNLGEAHSFLHQDGDAVRSYRQATRLKPDDEEAFYQLGMAEIRLANYAEAIAAFQKALELDPNDYRATDGLENAKEGAQRIREGKKHAEEMFKKQLENANANGNMNTNTNSGARPTPKRSPRNP